MGQSRKNVNVLFTSVGRRVELINAWKNEYKNLEINGLVIGTDIDPMAPALAVVDKFYIVPRTNMDSFIPSIVKICKKEKINLIFPLIDPDIPVLSLRRNEIEKTGAKLMVLSEHSVKKTVDKWFTFELFKKAELNTPNSWIPETVNFLEMNYPLFIKPRFGSASKNTYQINTKKELYYYIEKVDNPIIQQFIFGPEITNDVICDLNGKVMGVISRERIEVRSGEVSKGKTIYNEKIIDGCIRIAYELNAIGPITVQCITKNDIPYFTEINARYGGGAPLGIYAGMNSPRWYLANESDIKIKIPPIGSYKKNIYLTRYDTSLFLTENELEEIRSNYI